MKTILFPTDFSNNALHASQYAGMLARSMNARVVFLHVHYIPMVAEYNDNAQIRTIIQNDKMEAEVDMKVFMTKFIEKTQICPDRISHRIEYGANVPEKILVAARSINAHFIVMGTKGAANTLDKWLGTNAQKVMKESICPVWIIPANAVIKFPRKIMYAADFKKDEFLATHQVLQIVEPLGATCKVIHINDFISMKADKNVHELVGALKDEFKEDNVFVRKINRADIIEGLESYINLYKPDVLALAVHEKSFLENILNTSVSKHFIQGADVPMLTFRK